MEQFIRARWNKIFLSKKLNWISHERINNTNVDRQFAHQRCSIGAYAILQHRTTLSFNPQQ